MSNPSLKDQLTALSLGRPLAPENQEKKAVPKKQEQTKRAYSNARPPVRASVPARAPKSKPAWLEQAQYGVELLKAYFPACFKEFKDIMPLKKGIKQDLVKRLSVLNDIAIADKGCMVNSLAYYVNSVAYYKSVNENATRIDLDGQPTGAVTAEEAKYSSECRKAKLEKKQTSGAKTNLELINKDS